MVCCQAVEPSWLRANIERGAAACTFVGLGMALRSFQGAIKAAPAVTAAWSANILDKRLIWVFLSAMYFYSDFSI